MTKLRYEVLVLDGIARARPDLLPDGGPIMSSPLASTLAALDIVESLNPRAVWPATRTGTCPSSSTR